MSELPIGVGTGSARAKRSKMPGFPTQSVGSPHKAGQSPALRQGGRRKAKSTGRSACATRGVG
jgi:hypothetical protein